MLRGHSWPCLPAIAERSSRCWRFVGPGSAPVRDAMADLRRLPGQGHPGVAGLRAAAAPRPPAPAWSGRRYDAAQPLVQDVARSRSRRSDPLRAEVVYLLDGGGAHLRAVDVFARVPASARGWRPQPDAHTPWQLLEHLRIAQHDILEWSRDPAFVSPPWPEGHWPATAAPPDARAWERSRRAFMADLDRALAIARDPSLDLLAPLAHARDASWLGQLILIATHNSYHLGQIVYAVQAGRPASPRRSGKSAMRHP